MSKSALSTLIHFDKSLDSFNPSSKTLNQPYINILSAPSSQTSIRGGFSARDASFQSGDSCNY